VTNGPACSENFFIPAASGSVRVSAFSLDGALLYSKTIDVAGGKKYGIDGFVKKHVPLAPSILRCVKIQGTGIDILRKIR
jgi:hypothetical protein